MHQTRQTRSRGRLPDPAASAWKHFDAPIITGFERSPDRGRGLAREEGDLVLFESGAILLHLGQTHAVLLPSDANARARAISWMFAALSTMEPPVLEFTTAMLFERDKPWYEQRQPMLETRLRNRLGQLSARLGDAECLDGAFSVGDLLMISVLLRLASSGLVDDYPAVAAYVARGVARPAYQRAFAAQLAVFEALVA